MPRLNIIMPCFNAEAFVGAALDSVLRMDFEDWNLLVVDDGSTDGSAALAREYSMKDHRIHVLSQSNAGASRARNRGMTEIADPAPYVWFLDADDCVLPESARRFVEYLDEHPAAVCVASDYMFIDEHGAETQPGASEADPNWRYVPDTAGIRAIDVAEPVTPFEALFCWCRIIPSAWVLRRDVVADAGGFTDALTIGHDVDLALKCSLRGEVHVVPEKWVQYRRHSAQKTAFAARIREEEARLWHMWLSNKALTPDQQDRVRQAWRFKERRFVPMMLRRWAQEAAQRGDHRGAAKLRIRSIKKALLG